MTPFRNWFGFWGGDVTPDLAKEYCSRPSGLVCIKFPVKRMIDHGVHSYHSNVVLASPWLVLFVAISCCVCVLLMHAIPNTEVQQEADISLAARMGGTVSTR